MKFSNQIKRRVLIDTGSFANALVVSETTAITLPSIEQAKNLGFGIWLITSANADFTFRESSLATSSSSRSFAGCHICIITLACGMQIHLGHIILRSALTSCSTIPAIKLRLSLPDPLESLIMQVPPLDDLPLYTSEAEAGVTLLKAVRKKLISSLRVRQVNQLVELARPFAQNMKLLKPSLTREFNQYVPFKVSFTLTVPVFIVSTLLHLVFMYVYHRFNLKDRIFPKKTAKKNAIKPVLHVPHECSPAVPEKLSKRYHLLPPNEKTAEILPLPPPQKKRLSLSFINKQRHLHLLLLNLPTLLTTVFFKKKTEPQQEGNYTTVEQNEETPARLT